MTPQILRMRDRILPLDSGVLVMGIVNVTPDSFSDGGRYVDPGKAIDRIQAMVEEGVDLIDIGAESTRPGAELVETHEEIRRLKPVLEALASRFSIPISVDTRKAAVAQLALDHGAVMVNDVSALQFDPEMGPVVAKYRAGLVLMHMQGEPLAMQENPSYGDVVEDIRAFFEERLEAAYEYGVSPENIVLDPGIGFGKTNTHNLILIANLHRFFGLGRPLMIGVSNKSVIGQVVDKPVEERRMGTAGAVAVAVMEGVHLIRVHEVGPMRDVMTMVKALREHQNN